MGTTKLNLPELVHKIYKQIKHHEWINDGLWGDVKIKVEPHEFLSAFSIINSHSDWEVLKLVDNTVYIKSRINYPSLFKVNQD